MYCRDIVPKIETVLRSNHSQKLPCNTFYSIFGGLLRPSIRTICQHRILLPHVLYHFFGFIMQCKKLHNLYLRTYLYVSVISVATKNCIWFLKTKIPARTEFWCDFTRIIVNKLRITSAKKFDKYFLSMNPS